MTLYKNKYRIESIRLPNHNYGANGYYFVTICTKNKIHYFGNIINSKLHPSQVGKIAQQYWQEIPNHFDYVEIDAYVIMPNHVHGIIIINDPQNQRIGIPRHNPGRDVACNVSTNNTGNNHNFSTISPKSGSLGAIIRSYKSAVTRWCRQYDGECFAWQSRFYEHIIRNDTALNRLRKYIINNPARWQRDRFYRN